MMVTESAGVSVGLQIAEADPTRIESANRYSTGKVNPGGQGGVLVTILVTRASTRSVVVVTKGLWCGSCLPNRAICLQ